MMMTVIMITGKSDSEIVTKQAAIDIPRMMLRKGSRHFNTTAIAIIMSMVVTTAKLCQ